MMENRKKIGLIIIAIAVLLLVIIILFILKIRSVNQVSAPEPIEEQKIVQTGDTSTLLPEFPTSTISDNLNYKTYDLSKEPPYKVNDNDAVKLASSFAERLGSFSNQSDYSNIEDLQIFMTQDMKDWAKTYVNDLRTKEYIGEYYGITTKSLTTKLISYQEKEGRAKITVLTERKESYASSQGDAFRQSISLDLVKVNNQWLIDAAYWEKK